MLSTEQIAEIIRQPESLGRDHLDGLKALSEKYPYTQIFSILYLKALGESGSVNFDDELLRHSYRIGDRVQLYKLIQTSTSFSESTDITKEEPTQEEPAELIPETSSTTVESVELQEEIIPSEHIEKITTQAPITPSINEDVTPLLELEPNSSEEEAEPTPVTTEPVVRIEEKEEEEEPIIEQTKSEDNVDENILHHALATNYQLEELTDEEIIDLEKRKSLEKNDSDKEEINEPIVESNTKLSFTSWLAADENYSEQKNTDKDAIQAIVSDFADFDPSDQLFGEVEKPKQEFFSPTKKAKESLNEESLPVSQTLAKIYAMQGNYPKAIEAYEQLSLKYPEKKIFFANLIKDLKNKLNT